MKEFIKVKGRGLSLMCMCCLAAIPCFAQVISETAAMERSFTMIGFFVLILCFSGVAYPWIKAHKKGSEGFVIFQIILNLMFAVLILKIKNDNFFFFKLKFLWLAISWALVLVNVYFITKHTRE